MKAIVTVIDNDGRVIEKDKVIMSYDEIIDLPKDCVATKTTYFRFGITRKNKSPYEIIQKHTMGCAIMIAWTMWERSHAYMFIMLP